MQDQRVMESGVMVSTVGEAGAEERGLVLGMVKANEKVRKTEQMVELLQAEVVEEKRSRVRAEEKMRGTEERVRLLQTAMEEEKRRRVEAEEKIRETDSLQAAKEEEKRRREEAEKRIRATEQKAEVLQVQALYQGSIQALFRLYSRSMKALLEFY